METKVKTSKTPEISLVDELLAIQAGKCIYCMRGIAHPAHSRCSLNAASSLSKMRVA